ncbi:MAG: hypothetical protein ACRBK7_06420 [Acidimicrobiales bacterium]
MQSDPDPSNRSFPSNDDGQPTDHVAESLAESFEPALVIATFRDAVGLAMQLADEYAFVSAGVVLDSTGAVNDIVLAEGIGKTIKPVVNWLAEASDRWPVTPQLLLLSVRPFEIDVIREQDLRLYRQACWAIAAAGGGLIDWIETDGDLFRSYAYVTCPAAAWVNDQPEDRLNDGSGWWIS